MQLPFRLDEGIYLEDTDKMLLWGDQLDNIVLIDNPIIKGHTINWHNKYCFDGQQVNISVLRNEYFNCDDRLEFVHFEQDRHDPWNVFEKYSKLFRKTLGSPSQTSDDGFGRSTELWTLNNFQLILGVGERFVEFEIFGIHKGKPFWKLNT